MSKEINQRVIMFRKLANLNQAQVAEKMGMKPSTYSQMERAGNISLDRLMKLAEILNVTINDILPEDKKTPKETDDEEKKDDYDFSNNYRQPMRLRRYVNEDLDFEYSLSSRLTLRDKNMIKMYSNFSEKDKVKVCEFVKQIYDKK